MITRLSSVSCASCVGVLVLVLLGCPGPRLPEPPVAVIGSPEDMERIDAARRARYDTIAGHGDEQRLALVDSAQPHRLAYGPLVRIAPRARLDTLSDASFYTPQLVAVIVSKDGPYPKLGIERDTNFLWIQRVRATDRDPERWEAFMISLEKRMRTPLRVERTAHSREEAATLPAGARWLWRDDDEDIWTRCGTGCCSMTGFRSAQE